MNIQGVSNNYGGKNYASKSCFMGKYQPLEGIDKYIPKVSSEDVQKFQEEIGNFITAKTSGSLNVVAKGKKKYGEPMTFSVVEKNNARVFQKNNLSFSFVDEQNGVNSLSDFYYNSSVGVEQNIKNFIEVVKEFAKGSIL